MENSTVKSEKDAHDVNHRDIKLEEQVLKSLNTVPDTEGKLQILLKKFVEIEKEKAKLYSNVKLQEKRFETLLRDKDSLQKEHNKNVLMRTKLEQVCREQQKLLKSVQNESMKHKETQAKFQHSINEISATLTKNNDENIKLKEDNIEMTKRLKYLAEQYQLREKQLEKINEQIQLENQLHEAKLAKVQMEGTIEKEILLREKQGALDELLKCKKAIQELQKREELLKEQLSLYTSKYDDFQSSLQKSNDIFVTYKTELEKMVKKTKKLEKESADWKRKCEKSTASLLDLATEKQVKDEYIAKTAKQMQQLQKLLRTLQAERTILYKTLKENNIDTPAMPALPPEPEPIAVPQIKQQPDKIEVMAKNCAELKQSLALLQNQMSILTTKQNDTAPAAVASTAGAAAVEPAKGRSKKSKARSNKTCPTKDKNQSDVDENNKKDAKIEDGLGEAVKATDGTEDTPPGSVDSINLQSAAVEHLEQSTQNLNLSDEILRTHDTAEEPTIPNGEAVDAQPTPTSEINAACPINSAVNPTD